MEEKVGIITNDYYLKLEEICIRVGRFTRILYRFLIIIKNLLENAICFSFHFHLKKSSFFDTKRTKKYKRDIV